MYRFIKFAEASVRSGYAAALVFAPGVILFSVGFTLMMALDVALG
jgi:hypothetical protein